MGRSSQSHLRAREGFDSAGDTHYPGTDYTYDWPNTWPSGSGGGGPAIITAPVIAGTVSPGETLTLTQAPVWDGTETSSSWVWTADGVDIAGSTDQTTIVVPATPAGRYRVVASATNDEGTSVIRSNELLTAQTAPVINGVPDIDNLSPNVGDTLTATPADVTGSPTPVTSWQWFSSLTPVGTNSLTYTTVAGDEGNTITVVQTETNSVGSDDATSLGTDPVLPLPSITQLAITEFGPQPDANVDVPVTITADRDDSGVEVVLGLTSLGSPAAADFNTGATDLAGFIDLGVVAVTAGASSAAIDLPNDLDGDYTLHVLATGGGDGDVVSSGSTAINTVPVGGPTVIYDENFQGAVDSYETQVDGIDIFISADTIYTHDPAMTTPAHPTATVGGLTCDRNADFGSVTTRFPNITPGETITITANAMIRNFSGQQNTGGRVAIFWRDTNGAVIEPNPHDDGSFNATTTDQVALDGVYGPYVAPAGTVVVDVYYYGRQNRTNWIWRDLKVEKS